MVGLEDPTFKLAIDSMRVLLETEAGEWIKPMVDLNLSIDDSEE